MRICYICHGGFIHALPYVNYFKSAGHDVHVITLSPGLDWGVSTYNVGFGKTCSRSKGKWKYPISMLRARRLIRKLKPDILHTHYVTSGGLTGLISGFHPTITTVHGSDLRLRIKSRLWRHLIRRVFAHADCVNTCTEDQKRKVIGLGVKPEKIFLATVGVDTEKYSFTPPKAYDSTEPLKIVTTRRMERIYNHPTIVRALAILNSKNFNFQMTFAGGGELLQQLKAQVRKEGLGDRVKFLGGVDKAEIPEILRNNDIFLSSPFSDGISVALLEAMATGIFPIVSDIDVHRDWLQDGIDGFIHEVRDANALAECIMKVYDDPNIVVTAAHRNRERVVKLADTKTNMKLLGKVYDDLIDKKRLTNHIQKDAGCI